MSTVDSLRGAAAALAGLGTAELALALPGRPSLVDGVARVVVDTAPRPVVDLTVATVGAADKTLTRAGVTAGVLAAGALAARLRGSRRAAAVVLAAAVGTAASARRPPRAPLAATAAAVAGGLVTLGVLSGRRAGAAAALGGGALVAAGRLRARRHRAHDDRTTGGTVAVPRDGAEHWPGVSPLLTPVADFFATDVNLGAPLLDAATWRLRLGGLVERPVELTRDDLLALGTEDVDAVLVCIHNPPGGHRVGNGRWTGVPLDRLLAAARPLPAARALVSRSVDGFSMSYPLDGLRGYVVLGLNGAPLPAAHGYPARLLVPGLYGQYAGVKWLTALDLAAPGHVDYWVRRGWPVGPVRVRPHARIDHPRPGRCGTGLVAVRGVAWAPPDGLRAVEVSVDGGTWRPAELARALSGTAWRRWEAVVALAPGSHTLRARAVPRCGPPQREDRTPPFPAGAGGLHAVRVYGARDA